MTPGRTAISRMFDDVPSERVTVDVRVKYDDGINEVINYIRTLES